MDWLAACQVLTVLFVALNKDMLRLLFREKFCISAMQPAIEQDHL
jgi:hypothetical protein